MLFQLVLLLLQTILLYLAFGIVTDTLSLPTPTCAISFAASKRNKKKTFPSSQTSGTSDDAENRMNKNDNKKKKKKEKEMKSKRKESSI